MLRGGVVAVLALGVGCAAPGPPLPPTLNLPQVVNVSSLSAVRVGGEVHLRWTTPSQTTDKLPIRGAITAALCRDDDGRGAVLASGAANPCQAVAQIPVGAGASASAVDPLPAALAGGEPRLLAYRVQLRNAAGRSAAISLPVFVAAGKAPPPVSDFAAEPTRAGVVLRWNPMPNRSRGTTETESDPASGVELERTATPLPQTAPSRNGALPGSQKEPLDLRLRASADDSADDATSHGVPNHENLQHENLKYSDPGGMIDRSVEFGRTYTYIAQRVRTVQLFGRRLELRSEPSPPLTLTVRDIFPPAPPTGLIAAPAFAGQGDAAKPAIDLAWQPNAEAGVAGYRVYRSDAATGAGAPATAWQRLTPELAATPAWRDLAISAGRRYAYRVTAVSTAGNESQPGIPAEETAPTP